METSGLSRGPFGWLAKGIGFHKRAEHAIHAFERPFPARNSALGSLLVVYELVIL